MAEINLHSGGELIDYHMLREVPTPAPTATHLPIAHHEVVDMVKFALTFYGHTIVEEAHAIDHEGMRYFGLLTLESEDGLYSDTVGLRNSNDRTFPIGVAFGSRVFVCSNLAFIGDHVIKRRHTPRAKRDLPGLIAEIVEPLHEVRRKQRQTFEVYRETKLTDIQADHMTLDLYRRGVINIQRVPKVLEGYENPPHDEWGKGTAWTLFNATTAALEGRVAENPLVTRKLHDVIDGVCEAA